MENKLAIPLLETKGLTKYFFSSGGLLPGKKKVVKAVDGIDLAIYPGETFGLVGESGCGKSTLGRTILRLIEPTSGSVFYHGQPIEGRSKEELRLLKRKMQIVFQDPYACLNPRMTVLDLVKAPLDVFKIGTEQERVDKVVATLEYVGLGSQHLNRYPHEFSGGQRQDVYKRQIEHRYGYREVRQMLCEHLRQNKAPVLEAMKRITDVLCQLGRSYIEAGMDGVFYASLGGEKHFFTEEEFYEYIQPFDLQIMQAIKSAGGYVILHICKENLQMERYAGYASVSDVVNWGVYETNYSLTQGRKLFNGCAIMGGFANHPGTVLVDGPAEAIRLQARKAIQEAGHLKFILGADCTLPTGVCYGNIHTAVEAARE